MIKKGDIVRFLPEFADEGDDEFTRVAVADEDGGRVLIVTRMGWPVDPSEVVQCAWLEVVQSTR